MHDLRMLKFRFRADLKDVICELGKEDSAEMEYMKMGEALLPIFRQTARNHGIPLHAALIERDGEGVLLGGSGGIGKSTCSRRVPKPWRAISDDETLIVKTGPGRYAVHPFPTWSDYVWKRAERTWRVEESVRLKAIFFLEQSEKDECRRVGQSQSAVMINQLAGQVCAFGCRQLPPKELRAFRLGFFESASQIARTLPCFTLKVSLKGRFWEKIERALNEVSE